MARLFGLIVLFTMSVIFIVLNLDNKCDVSFGFRTLTDIPVFLSVFSAFVLGMVFALLLSFISKRKKASKPDGKAKSPKTPKKIRGGKPAGAEMLEPQTTPGQDKPYGID